MERRADIAADNLPMRPAATVMDVNRLGTLYPYPLSFMRSLVRRITREGWAIERQQTELCDEGFGHAVYRITTPRDVFSYVVFAHYLDEAARSDRVIAEAWDMTATLCAGEVDADRLEHLRANVPLQEKGRLDPRCLVLTRANRSLRNYPHVIERLASGQQPDMDAMAVIGYLYRTTAVYGSGKFGMADWDKVREHYPDFAHPFAAEMFSCFLIRDFSLTQADHVARCRAPGTAIALDADIKRYIGIGNATGLGMAPYLINHPQLIDNWITVRETALARVKRDAVVTPDTRAQFQCIAEKACLHLAEIATDNEDQNAINARARTQMLALAAWERGQDAYASWTHVTDHADETFGPETQELLHAVLMEVFADLILDLEDALDTTERYDLVPEMRLGELRALIEAHYDWALEIDFADPNADATFWYRSEEKQEPRLGRRREEPGADREMTLGIARSVRECYDAVCAQDANTLTARFVLAHPRHRYIVRRMQAMAQAGYGEIRLNALHADVLPIHLLRCKLSFFGVGKFNPRSRLWVRNTMFQGAPLIDDVNDGTASDDWCFPIRPDVNAAPHSVNRAGLR